MKRTKTEARMAGPSTAVEEEVPSTSEDEDEEDSEQKKDPFDREREPEVEQFRQDVSSILQSVVDKSTTTFATGGELQGAPLVPIQLLKTGDIVYFPVYDTNATGIIKQLQQAPFGKGKKTILDKTVRNSWQIDSKEFKILNPKWDSYVAETVVPRIGAALGVTSPFTASIYKFLLYETGSFFKPHRDSEKEDGMFGTLVIQLPSKYCGGALQVRHDGKTQTFTFDNQEGEFKMFMAAFYADCEHEIVPLTSGYRSCLVYNLVVPADSPRPAPPQGESESVKALVSYLRNWPAEPALMGYYLKHKYSASSLTSKNLSLKTTDGQVASILQSVASQLPLNIYVCLISIHMSGSAECAFDDEGNYDGYPYRGWNRGKRARTAPVNNVGFHEDVDVEDMELEIENIIGLDGKKFPYTPENENFLTVDDTSIEILPVGIFRTAKPDNLSLQPTGNEGTELEKWYKGAMILFWPSDRHLDVLQELGISTAVIIKDIYLQSIAKAKKNKAQLLDAAKQLLQPQKVQKEAPKPRNYWMSYPHCTNAAKAQGPLLYKDLGSSGETIFNSICDLKDPTLIVQFLQKFTQADAIVGLLRKQVTAGGWWEQCYDEIEKILKNTKAVATFVINLTQTPVGQNEKPYILHLLKTSVETVLANPNSESRPRFLSTFCLQADAAELDVTELLAELVFESKLLKPTEVSMAIMTLIKPGTQLKSVWHNLASRLAGDLKSTVEKSSKAALDWKRTVSLATPCDCQDCQDFGAFLRSDEVKFEIKGPEKRRKHVIKQAAKTGNLQNETVRGTVPLRLVFTKLQIPELEQEKTDATRLMNQLSQAIGSSQ